MHRSIKEIIFSLLDSEINCTETKVEIKNTTINLWRLAEVISIHCAIVAIRQSAAIAIMRSRVRSSPVATRTHNAIPLGSVNEY